MLCLSVSSATRRSPSCSSCIDRAVQCEYSQTVSQFVNLSVDGEVRGGRQPSPQRQVQPCKGTFTLRSSRPASHGRGSFHVLKPMDLDSMRPPELPIVSPSTRLASQFAHVLRSAIAPGLRLQLWGTWMTSIPCRIGVDPLLDRSAACLVAAHEERHSTGTKRSTCAARQLYGGALLLLRKQVADGPVDLCLIAATKLLMAFE